MQQSSNTESVNILQTMTTAMKQFKQILHQLESDSRQLFAERFNKDYKESKIQDNITGLLRNVAVIQSSHCKKMFCSRLVGRVVEIVSIFRNRFSVNESMYWLRDHLTSIIDLIKEYQLNNQPNPGLNLTSNQNQYNIQFLALFDRICQILKKSVRELREKACRLKILTSTASVPINCQQNTGRQKQKERERRHSISEGPIINSMENKYKLTKEVINNVALFVGMDIDVPYLRGLLLQARCNLPGVEEDRIDNNFETLKAKDLYLQNYNQWKLKVKRRISRKQKQKQKQAKINQCSPKKGNKNSQNRSAFDKSPSIMAKTATKMPKLIQSSELSGNYQDGDRKRQQFKNMQALTFNRQFIHLSQIKNQKAARRPYAEVKQVLVAGDQLNYYSHKNPQNSYVQPSKASFFMQRAVKNEKILIRKKSYIENTRLVTEE